MRAIYFLFVAPFAMLVSCQRESGLELRTEGDSSLLIKRVDESSEPGQADKYTGTYNYEYNAGKKLIRISYSSIVGVRTATGESLYTRDGRGRIVTIENRSGRFINGLPYTTPEGPSSDTSIVSVVYVNDTTHQVWYTYRSYQVNDKTSKDSIVYEYDINGHVKKTLQYYLPLAVHSHGDTFVLPNYSAWTFSASGSLLENTLYANNNGNFELNLRYRYDYDHNVNPLYTGDDVFLSQWSDFSPNNVVKQNVYIPGTGEDYDNTAVYIYQPDKKPASVSYFSPPTVVTGTRQSTFYYK